MADVLTYDSAYLAKERKRVKDDVSYARYKVGSTWYQTDIQSAEILSDGRVEVTFTIDHTVSGNITVTGIELYDRNGTRIANTRLSSAGGRRNHPRRLSKPAFDCHDSVFLSSFTVPAPSGAAQSSGPSLRRGNVAFRPLPWCRG